MTGNLTGFWKENENCDQSAERDTAAGMRRIAARNPLKWIAHVAALRSRGFWLRLVCACCVLAGLGVLARNPIARLAGTIAGSAFLDTRVEIGNLDIGWSQITVDDVTVFEPAFPDQVQLYVARVALIPSLRRGFSDGVWLERLTIDQPEMHLRFDQHGNLLSVFPQASDSTSTDSPATIPLQHLVVNQASAIVHQNGRNELRIENVNLYAEFSNEIAARLSVPSILSGKIDFRCRLDAKTFAGSTCLDVVGMELDTRQLADLPLAPDTIGDEPLAASFAMSLQGTHPPSDWDFRHHLLTGRISTRNISSPRFGQLCQRVDLEVKQADGIVGAKIQADPLSGKFEFEVSADCTQPIITAELTTSLQDCDLQRITEHVPELAELAGTAMATGSANATWNDGKLDFRGGVRTALRENRFDSVTLPTMTAEFSTHGTLVPTRTNPLQGVLEGSFATTSFKLTEMTSQADSLPIVGEMLASGKIYLPLDRVKDPTSYRADAQLQLRDIAAVELGVPDCEITALLRDGIATIGAAGVGLHDASGKAIVDLRFQAVASLLEGGRLDANADVQMEPTGELVEMLGLNGIDPRGHFSCRVDAGCLMSELASTRGWTANASAHTQSVEVAGESIDDVDLHIELDQGELISSPLVLKWRDNTITVQTEGELNDTLAVRAKLNSPNLKLRDVSEVLSRFSPSPLPLAGLANIDGQLFFSQELNSGKRTAHASGSANLEQAVCFRTRIGEASVRWLANLDGLILSTSSDDFLGGRFDVNARIAELDWTNTQLDGTFAEVQVPRLISLTRQKLPSTGVLDGGFRVTSIASMNDLSGEGWIRSRQATLQNVPLELAQGFVTVQQGRVTAGGDGHIADGRFTTSAQTSLPSLLEFFARSSPQLSKIPITAQFHLDHLPMSPLVLKLHLPLDIRFLGGSVSTDIVRDAAALDGRHLATVTASVDELRWKHAQLSNRISANLVVHPNQIELKSVHGNFADGSLSGKAIVQLGNTPTGRFDFVASRVNLRRATSPFGLADISGSGTVNLHGRLGQMVTGHADVTVENAVAGGVDVRHVRLPIDWTVRSAARTVRWQCRAGMVSVGGGNVRIATEGSYANSLNMNSTLRIERVDLAKLMRRGSAGSGILDGVVSVRAKQARSPQQIVGTYDLEMKKIEALEFPVLNQLPKMVSLSPPVPGRGEDGGTIHGRIGGGLVYIDEVALHQSNVQVFVAGIATMQGKLDLDVIVSTESTSPADQLVSMLNSPLMLAAPAPVALIAKANDLLKDRVVRVHVGGTAETPTLRLQPGKQLTQEAIKFFLTSGFGSTATRVADMRPETQPVNCEISR